MAQITAKELAVKLGTDPRTVRKFLRSTLDDTPGKGSRYAIEGKQVQSLKKKFKAWDENRTPKVEEVEPELIEENDIADPEVAEELDAIE